MMNQIKTKKHVKSHNSDLEELLNWGPMMEISRHGALNLKKKHTWVMGSNQVARGSNDSLTLMP
jgi:hypothetical protein